MALLKQNYVLLTALLNNIFCDNVPKGVHKMVICEATCESLSNLRYTLLLAFVTYVCMSGNTGQGEITTEMTRTALERQSYYSEFSRSMNNFRL